MTKLLKQQCLQYPIQIKLLKDRETKEYYLKKQNELSLKSIGEIPPLVEQTHEQKEWVLHRLKQPVEYWHSWFVDQYFTQEQKVAMGLNHRTISGTGIK